MVQEMSLRPGRGGELIVLLIQMRLKFQDVLVRTRTRLQRGVTQTFAGFSVVLLLLWISVFLYGSLYYSYMPNVAFSTAVHYYQRSGCESHAAFLCSYPLANVSMTRNRKHVLTFGQAYRISLLMEMPDSQVNQAVGMFMIRTTFYSQDGGQVISSAQPAGQVLSATSSRFSMLRYQSNLLKVLKTLLILPAFLTGLSEQSQVLEVELFSNYVDDPYSPSVTAVIEILSNQVQIYSSHLNIHADFTGIRYLLFNFPLLSAFVGVATNFIFLSVIFILSYLRQLFTRSLAPKQLFTVRQQPDSEDTNSNRQEDDSEAAAGAAEVPTSPQETATNPSKESHIGTDAEATSSQVPSDSNNVEASRAH
ncbi:seipin-like isoform X1 [Takifugu flavidus]|uniref:seipin-like isoform X1 n=2 Tax=Takifugu flavidus TaxID=433684 RepID=UPI0025444DE7|nr:seipin-like isoform X1 [Takifugu flavidus]XP_056900102.1 seipin-like isoform X1 [Takifugu flavidus]